MACAIVLSGLCFFWGYRASGQSPPYIEIRFPGQQDFGHIYALPKVFNYEQELKPVTRLLCKAQGTVHLPRDYPLLFAPNDSISENARVFTQLPDNAFVVLDLEKLSLGDAQIGTILHMKSLVCLNMEGCEIGDSGVAKLVALPNLINIDLYGTDVTGATIKDLTALPHLTRLRLGCNKLNLACIDDILRLKKLNWLNLDRVALTDKELLKLSHMERLRGLEMPNNPKITGIGLGYLKKMPNLNIIDLRGCNVKVNDLIALKPSKIQRIVITPESFTRAELAAIREALKGKFLVCSSRQDTMPPELFAPLK